MIGRVEVTRRGVARAGLALAVAAVAACVVYFGGRVLGLGGDAPALGQGDPLALTISVPEVCETGQEDPGYGSVWGEDDEGNWVRTGKYGPFYRLSDISTVELEWHISGGTEPYEISVQGQALLSGPTGSTLVYCAESLPYDELDFTESRDEYARTKLEDRPVVNPGPMTFEASVKDASGLSATTTTRIYVIIDCTKNCNFDVYPPGYTYRLFGIGRLLTIPAGLHIGVHEVGIGQPGCAVGAPTCQRAYGISLANDPHGTSIAFGANTGYLGYSSNDGTTYRSVIGEASGAQSSHPQGALIDRMGASLDQSPQMTAN